MYLLHILEIRKEKGDHRGNADVSVECILHGKYAVRFLHWDFAVFRGVYLKRCFHHLLACFAFLLRLDPLLFIRKFKDFSKETIHQCSSTPLAFRTGSWTETFYQLLSNLFWLRIKSLEKLLHSASFVTISMTMCIELFNTFKPAIEEGLLLVQSRSNLSYKYCEVNSIPGFQYTRRNFMRHIDQCM